MIARLTGTVVDREDPRAIIDVQGVGYEVYASGAALDLWLAEGRAEAHIFTHMYDGATTLYGFTDPVSRKVFMTMLEVKGVGPKVALATLDLLPIAGLVRAVAEDDIGTLSKVKGVGKRLAQRMALELKDKLPAAYPVVHFSSPPKVPAGRDTLELALDQLGYKQREIDQVRLKLEEAGVAPDRPVGERLKAALRILYGGRQ